jgi:hypothetical protein
MTTATEVRTIAKQRGWSREAITALIEQNNIPPIDQRTEQDLQYLLKLLDTTHPVGSIVHKQSNLGWTGIVLKIISPNSVEVLWWLDKYPTLMDVDSLRVAEKTIAHSYREAFQCKGVNS